MTELRTQTQAVLAWLMLACINSSLSYAEQPKDSGAQEGNTLSVVYSTDLFRPCDDPDDHFDLMTLMSCKEIHISALILDNHRTPNFKAVETSRKLFSRSSIPCEAGLRRRLKSPEDKGQDQPADHQKAVELILRILNSAADHSVVVITTGSLRDVCAAYNRDPKLFRRKIKKIYPVIGDSFGKVGAGDHNTRLDVNAWRGVMTADIPIDWIPCNPSKGRGGPSPYVSYWRFRQSDLLQNTPRSVQAFFRSEGIFPTKDNTRHMWSTVAVIEAAQLRYYRKGSSGRWARRREGLEKLDWKDVTPYKFVPITLTLNAAGKAEWKEATSGKAEKRILKVIDDKMYNKALFGLLLDRFGQAGSTAEPSGEE